MSVLASTSKDPPYGQCARADFKRLDGVYFNFLAAVYFPNQFEYSMWNWCTPFSCLALKRPRV